MGRAPCCDKTKVKRGPWSPEEDHTLKNYVETYGTGGNWIALPQKAGLKRCGKSCRLRWLNYLRPNIKHGGFTEEEDSIILSLYHTIGSRWSVIASQLPGRTDNDVKNYWNTKLKKKLLAATPGPSYPTAATGNYMSSSNNNTNHSSSNFSSVSSMDHNNMLWPYFPNETVHLKDQETITSKMLMEAMMAESVENNNSISMYDSGPNLFPHQEGLSPSFSMDNNGGGSWTSSLSANGSAGEDYEAAFLGGLTTTTTPPYEEYTNNAFDLWSSMLSFDHDQ